MRPKGARSSACLANRNRIMIDHRLSRQNVKLFPREPEEATGAKRPDGSPKQASDVAHGLCQSRQRIVGILLIFEGNLIGILDIQQGLENGFQVQDAAADFDVVRFRLRVHEILMCRS